MGDYSKMNGCAHGDAALLDTETEQKCSNNVTEDHISQNLKTFPSQVLVNNQVTQLLLDYNDLTFLPESFGTSLSLLQFFSAIGNDLSSLPPSFGGLCHLSEIYLNENGLKYLPESFCCLKSLKVLKLTGNSLESLPENFGELTSLELFHCDENGLKCLPESLRLLEHLRELEIGCNSLTVLIEDFGMMKSLQTLNISSNQLEAIPDSFGNLACLKTLDISCNKIKYLPQYSKSVKSLQKLFIESNLLHTLPDWISDMSEIREFSAKDNQFQNQPLKDSFGEQCVKLRHLDLSGNYIGKLPDNLGNCENLEFLHLGSVIGELERRNFQNGNWLAKIPDSLCKLAHLRELHLDENQITDLPKDFGDLVSLEILDLGQNLLHELPESFGNLTSLRVCLLSKNHLQWLPSSFGNLRSMEDLRLDDNELGELPESFCQLTTLKTLDLFSNRLRQIPEALHSLTNLVRLDLDSNDFKVPLSDVPHIGTRAKYPERDPTLKNNWRGRPREDVVNVAGEIIKEEGCVDFEFEPPPPSLNYNEDFLISAMERNLSIWKSHTNNSERRSRKIRPSKRNYYGNMDVGGDGFSENGSENSDHGNRSDSNQSDDDEFVPPLLVEPKLWSGYEQPKPTSSTDGANNSSTSVIEETECWDDEVESLPEYYDNVPVNVHPTKMYYAPVYNGQFTFAPHDLHTQDYVKRPNLYPVEEGQFENCDVDQTSEISVDPIF